jgi:hypothetical protein
VDLTPGWSYGVDGDWRVGDYDPMTRQQLFMSRFAGDNETRLAFQGTGQARIDVFECGSQTPTRSEVISWGP